MGAHCKRETIIIIILIQAINLVKWNNLLRNGVESPLLVVFVMPLDSMLGNLGLCLPEKG